MWNVFGLETDSATEIDSVCGGELLGERRRQGLEIDVVYSWALLNPTAGTRTAGQGREQTNRCRFLGEHRHLHLLRPPN